MDFSLILLVKRVSQVTGFPGSLGVKNPCANARDMGSIPDPGRSHMLRSNRAHGAQPLSLCPGAQGGHVYWTHVLPGAHAAKQAKPPQ